MFEAHQEQAISAEALVNCHGEVIVAAFMISFQQSNFPRLTQGTNKVDFLLMTTESFHHLYVSLSMLGTSTKICQNVIFSGKHLQFMCRWHVFSRTDAKKTTKASHSLHTQNMAVIEVEASPGQESSLYWKQPITRLF